MEYKRERICHCRTYLTGKLASCHQLKNIADFIERNASQLPYLTENDIARGVGTSIASVSRFWQSIGSANLKEFKSKHRELHAVTPAVK